MGVIFRIPWVIWLTLTSVLSPSSIIVSNSISIHIMAATRDDGRSSTELRSLKIELGALARMDGSGKFGFGQLKQPSWLSFDYKLILSPRSTGSTQVIASFHGPQEVRIRDELVDRATLEVVHRPLDGIAGEIPSLSPLLLRQPLS